MKKTEIEISDKEIKELLTIIELCQSNYTISGGRLIRAIILYFGNKYNVSTEYSHGFINGEKCLITERYSDSVIASADEVKRQLIDNDILEVARIHAEDKYGNKIFTDNLPRMISVYKIKH